MCVCARGCSYRNHGSDVGRVLVGVQVSAEDRAEKFPSFLRALGYYCVEETDNPVYQRFLK